MRAGDASGRREVVRGSVPVVGYVGRPCEAPLGEQEGPLRSRHLRPVHHAGDARARGGTCDPGPARVLLHGRPGARARQTGRARRSVLRRLPAVAPTRTSPSRSSRRRTTGKRSAAGCSRRSLRRGARRAVRVQQQRRWVPVPRPHRAESTRARAPALPRPVPEPRRALAAATGLWRGLDEPPRCARFPVPRVDGSGKEPRYYQRIAVQRTIEAIARGQRRLLLVMATGTGKTYTAFQILWRLWKAGTVRAGAVPRRPQHPGRPDHPNDFKPFGAVMTKVQNRRSTSPTRSTWRSTRR
jgi:hypothetical protein